MEVFNMTEEQEIEKALKKKKTTHAIPSKDLLSSGSTLLNLACSGRTVGAFAKGHYYWLVGDSSSGKSFLALTCMAEALKNESFDEYRVIYDNSENGALMNIEKFFGAKVAKRLEPPRGTKEEPIYSETVDDMYFNISDAIEDGRPFIYVEDSMDVLESAEDEKKFKKIKSASRRNKEVSGDFGMAKAKTNSKYLRKVVSGLRKSRSILIIISQTRDNVGWGAQFDPKRSSGGRSLKFYATLEIWSSVKELLKKVVNGKKRQIGIISKVRIKKNRIVGRDRTVEIPILHSFGIDEIGSLVDYLIDEGHWKGTENKLSAPEFDFKGSKEELIQKIEENDLEQEIKAVVNSVWTDIERRCSIKRKSRYE